MTDKPSFLTRKKGTPRQVGKKFPVIHGKTGWEEPELGQIRAAAKKHLGRVREPNPEGLNITEKELDNVAVAEKKKQEDYAQVIGQPWWTSDGYVIVRPKKENEDAA